MYHVTHFLDIRLKDFDFSCGGLCPIQSQPVVTPLSHECLVANAHELGTSQDSLETSQDGLGCVLAHPCMSRQVTETEREIPFFSHD